MTDSGCNSVASWLHCFGTIRPANRLRAAGAILWGADSVWTMVCDQGEATTSSMPSSRKVLQSVRDTMIVGRADAGRPTRQVRRSLPAGTLRLELQMPATRPTMMTIFSLICQTLEPLSDPSRER
jgi:hypothetical protein